MAHEKNALEGGRPGSRAAGLGVAGLSAVRPLLIALLCTVTCASCKSSKTSSAAPATSVSPAPLPGAYCTLDARSPFLVSSREGAIPSPDGDAAPTDEALPFAAEVGDAIAYDDGFAVGVLQDGHASRVFSVVTLDAEGRGRQVRLGEARGDVEPPRLASRKSTLFVAFAEPSPHGRMVRTARLLGTALTWGPSFEEARDESQALDLAAGDNRVAVVWDEQLSEGSVIKLMTFPEGDLGAPSPPHLVSAARRDCETPRIAATKTGFWLTCVCRKDSANEDDGGDRGEVIGDRWLVAQLLNETGAPLGPPRTLSPEDGHVLAYDVRITASDELLVVFRDDPTPSGSGGGKLLRAIAHNDRVDGPALITEETLGAGAPSLLGDWLTVSDASGRTMLGPVSPEGELRGGLRREDLLGSGEPLAWGAGQLLVARPAGRDVRLVLARCDYPRIP